MFGGKNSSLMLVNLSLRLSGLEEQLSTKQLYGRTISVLCPTRKEFSQIAPVTRAFAELKYLTGSFVKSFGKHLGCLDFPIKVSFRFSEPSIFVNISPVIPFFAIFNPDSQISGKKFEIVP